MNARGNNLLMEEKERNKVNKALPRLEAELHELISSWEAAEGREFLVGGTNFTAFIANQVSLFLSVPGTVITYLLSRKRNTTRLWNQRNSPGKRPRRRTSSTRLGSGRSRQHRRSWKVGSNFTKSGVHCYSVQDLTTRRRRGRCHRLQSPCQTWPGLTRRGW